MCRDAINISAIKGEFILRRARNEDNLFTGKFNASAGATLFALPVGQSRFYRVSADNFRTHKSKNADAQPIGVKLLETLSVSLSLSFF